MRKLQLQGDFGPVRRPFATGWEECSEFSAFVLIVSPGFDG